MKAFEDVESQIKAAYDRRRGNAAAKQRSSWFSWGNLFLQQERERRILALLKREKLSDLSEVKILEVGCGTGDLLREFTQWGARPENISGIDLLEDSIAVARALCPPGVRLEIASAAKLPFPDESLDIVLQSTVFTSVPDPNLRRQIAAEMLRVVRRGGLILWYDFTVDNPFNPDVGAVRAREVRELFPGCRLDLRRITLAPPLLRRLAPVSWVGCYLLSKIPFACTHLLGAIRKR